jgi:Pregnancy-associated plasma protein-A
MKKIHYIILCLFPLSLIGQVKDSTEIDKLKLPKIMRRFHTQKNHQRLLVLDKDLAKKRAFIEQSITSMPPLTTDVTIPVVVHILYKAGSSIRNLINESDVKQQLDMLSKDFRQSVKIEKHQADKKEKFSDKNAMDTRIDFCLADKDPLGKTTNGVLLVPTTFLTWGADDKMKSAITGGSTAWNTEKYLNIWVVSLPDSLSGYAQMPAGSSLTDGIVIDARYFGKKNNSDKGFPYTEGKTLTHLMGSYLNLYELWSDTVLCEDDGVEDTPIQNAHSFGCFGYTLISTCDGNPVVMNMNFMDNSNDECQYMFTNGQKRRMHATLTKGGIRRKLVESSSTVCKQSNVVNLVQRNDAPILTSQRPSSFTYRIYPNPAKDNINFEIGLEKSGNAELTVFNAVGR